MENILRQRKHIFNISLTTLNSLGRNLYRNFITVLGEAISNAWDADANNVAIDIDRENAEMVIIDDGVGMDEEDFDKKFLKIGFSKRSDGSFATKTGRPYIGRKGIGKLALLSCAKSVSIVTKAKKSEIVGSVIDNDELDKAIKNDETNEEYELGALNGDDVKLFGDRENGTLIRFRGLKPSIAKSKENIRRAIAMYFRFALLDQNFKIFLNGEEITLKDLGNLSEKTEFLWRINDDGNDEFITYISKKVKNNNSIKSKLKMHGFIASVKSPRDLKVFGTDEKIGIDLFVNGRLREKNLLQYFQSARIPESYMYGQIHYDELDGSDGVDRFTSSREGIIADDEKFQELLSELKTIMKEIIDEWDKLRINNREDGDDENSHFSKKERASKKLYNEVSNTFGESTQVEKWIKDLNNDATFNFSSYAECFVSENLLRKYLKEKGHIYSDAEKNEIKRWREREEKLKDEGNIQIDIRKDNDDLYYLGMDYLAGAVDLPPKGVSPQVGVTVDEKIFTPIRNAVMHTSRLTDEAKSRLTTTYDNIKARLVKLLNKEE